MKNAIHASMVAYMLSGPAAFATVLFNEDFSYPDGSLTTVSGTWSTHSGTAGQIQVTSGSIQLSDTQSEDVNRQIGQTITSGSIFGAFDFSVTAAAPVGGSDFEYFAHFGNGTTDFTSRIDVVAGGAGGDFTLGVAGGSATAQATFPTDLAFGTVYRAVIQYNRDSGISTLWVDPASTASPSIDSLPDTNDVEGFYFRESASSANETITIDNLTVATTFAEASGIPEPSTTLLGALAALLLLRRRRD